MDKQNDDLSASSQNKSSARVEQTRVQTIPDTKMVNVIRYNARPVVDIMSMNKVPSNHLKNYKKLNSDEYYDKKADKIKKYKHNTVKSEKSIKRSMKQLEKKLLNTFAGEHNELFVTLTTSVNTIDINVIKQFFDEFWHRIKRKHRGLEYACVFEMQQMRHSWHIHVMLKDFQHKRLYIANEDIEEEYWKQGETRTTRIRDIETNFEIDEEKAMAEPNGFLAAQRVYGIDKVISYMCKYKTKEIIPTGARAYSTSRNIKAPENERIMYKNIKQELRESNSNLLNEYATNIVSNNTDIILNTINKERWIKNNE